MVFCIRYGASLSTIPGYLGAVYIISKLAPINITPLGVLMLGSSLNIGTIACAGLRIPYAGLKYLYRRIKSK
jgi:hypothetical protein